MNSKIYEVRNAKGILLGRVWTTPVNGVVCCVVQWIVSEYSERWMFFAGPAAICFPSGRSELIAEFDGKNLNTTGCIKSIDHTEDDASAVQQVELYRQGFNACGWVIDQSGIPGKVRGTYGDSLIVRFLTCNFMDSDYTDDGIRVCSTRYLKPVQTELSRPYPRS